MVFPKARLVVSAVLFVVWIGFLAFLVVRTRNPVILSRPQLEAASVVVLADVTLQDGGPAPTVTVKKVVWPLDKEHVSLPGTKLAVDGLADVGREQGWTGEPGEYLLPLTKRDGGYEVTPIPLSPGYPHNPPRYVAIELLSVGPNKEKVQEIMSRLARPTSQEIPAAKGIIRRDVRTPQAEELKSQLEAAGARVRLRIEETRIYRAVPDALEQLEELTPKLGNPKS
jgi:hypothetical protein